MDEVKKFLYEAITLTLLLSIIGIGIRVFYSVKKAGSTVQQQISKENQQLEEAEITKYLGIDVPGGLVRSFVQDIYSDSITIFINDNKLSGDIDTVITELQSVDGNYYVNPLRKYTITIGRNANGVIDRVMINQI